MVEVSTSVLSVDEKNAIKIFYGLEIAKTNYFHIDVMDGKFVENDTTEKMKKYIETLKQISNTPLDVHLMVEDVESFLEEYIPYEPSIITIHYEACKDKKELFKFLEKIKNSGIKCGLSIKPNTPFVEIKEYLPYIHLLLIMTVEPGKGGQPLIPETIEKIKEAKKYIKENDIEIFIEADGGIKEENIAKLEEAGIDIAVVGNAIIESKDYTKTINNLKKE